MMHRRRRRRGRRGRNPSPVYINHLPSDREFIPTPRGDGLPIQLDPSELEVLRLVDLEDLSQEEAGERLLHEARRKVTQALIEGRPIRITHPQES